jgi:hypothetical protein
MKSIIFVCSLIWILFLSCNENLIKYELYSGGQFIFKILPEDIEYYDTTQSRGFIQVHELRLKNGFYNKDSFILSPPLNLRCSIGEKQFFSAIFFHSKQSEPDLWLNFKFRSSCSNNWTFQKQKPGQCILRTDNECNSIEFFHLKREIEESRDSYYEKQGYFKNM